MSSSYRNWNRHNSQYAQEKQDEKKLIEKIFKFLDYNQKKQIKIIIDNVNNRKENLNDALLEISNIVTPIMMNKNICKDEDRQNWIANKILSYIVRKKNIDEKFKIVDIGGGNGNVLREINSEIKEKYNISLPKENYICVETQSDWVEEYNFDNKTISYCFWDNNVIPIESSSVDIVLCMVTLHHMSDKTIQTTISEIKRILKPGGYVMIKEHDSCSEEALRFIEWEHHLYHILDEGYNKKIVQPEKYLNEHVDNFKSKEFWKEQFHGFMHIERTNRCLEAKPINDYNNVTHLYWDVYKNI